MTKEDIEHIDLSQEIEQALKDVHAKKATFTSRKDFKKALDDAFAKVFLDAGFDNPFDQQGEEVTVILGNRVIHTNKNDPALLLLDYLKVYKKGRGFLRKKIKSNDLATNFVERLEGLKGWTVDRLDLYGLFCKEIEGDYSHFLLPLERGLKESLIFISPAISTASVITHICIELDIDEKDYFKFLETRSLFSAKNANRRIRWHLEDFVPPSEIESIEDILSGNIDGEIRSSVVSKYFDLFLNKSMYFEDLIYAMHHPSKKEKQLFFEACGHEIDLIHEFVICEALAYCLAISGRHSLFLPITYEIKDGHILLHKKEPVG